MLKIVSDPLESPPLEPEDIPILILIFHRLEFASEVIDKLRILRPKKIYIRADGGRDPVEHQLCESTREAVIQSIDWECSVKTLFSEENLGLRRSVSSGIQWLFENEELGIILEEDCIPSLGFFDYVLTSLTELASLPRVGHIGGHEVTGALSHRRKSSPRVTTWPDVWGWATTGELWNALYITDPTSISIRKLIRDFFQLGYKQPLTWLAHLRNIEAVKSGRLDSWASIWAYSLWKNSYYSLAPSVSLVQNIGRGQGGTHYKRAQRFELSPPLIPKSYHYLPAAVEKEPAFLYDSLSKILGPKVCGQIPAFLVRMTVFVSRKISSICRVQ